MGTERQFIEDTNPLNAIHNAQEFYRAVDQSFNNYVQNLRNSFSTQEFNEEIGNILIQLDAYVARVIAALPQETIDQLNTPAAAQSPQIVELGIRESAGNEALDRGDHSNRLNPPFPGLG